MGPARFILEDGAKLLILKMFNMCAWAEGTSPLETADLALPAQISWVPALPFFYSK